MLELLAERGKGFNVEYGGLNYWIFLCEGVDVKKFQIADTFVCNMSKYLSTLKNSSFKFFFEIVFNFLISLLPEWLKLAVYFINELALKNWAMNMNCNPISSLLTLFLWRGGGEGSVICRMVLILTHRIPLTSPHVPASILMF